MFTEERASSHRWNEPLLREALGAALRDYRSRKEITLRELAEHARVSSGYLSELERGRKEVSSELLASVCKALDVSVAELLVAAARLMMQQALMANQQQLVSVG